MQRTIAEEERRIREHRQVHEKEKSIPQRKDDWPWASVTKSHAYVSLRRTVVSRTRYKVVAGYQTWGTETLIRNADFLDRRETLNFCKLCFLSVSRV